MERRPQQLSLAPVGHGGSRSGAGRPRKSGRRVVHHVRREAVPKGCPAHVTLRVRSDVPSLRTKRFLQAFRGSLRRGCERGDFRVVHYSVQGDHVHLFVEAAGKVALGCGMKSVSVRLVRAVHRAFGRRGPVLLGRYHARVLKTPREVRGALRYVLLNARKHWRERHPTARVPEPRLDPASSGRWFDGWRRTPWPRTPPDVPEVAPARFWLSTVGWRRRGRIDPAEVPV